MTKLYDVLIIGGGPAGLSIATLLARQLYTAVVLDSGVYRNARATHMHSVAGWDHANPADFRAKARGDLQRRYETIDFRSVTVRTVKKGDDGIFEAVGEHGERFRGRKLALGTGVRDMLEQEAEGYEECWGRSIFHCLFCHGFEERGAETVGVLVTGFLSTAQMVSHVALMAKRLSKHATVYTDGKPDTAAAARALIHSSKISFDDRKITRLEHLSDAESPAGPSVRIHFADGTSKTEAFIVSHPNVEQRSDAAEQLGLEMAATGEIQVSGPMNETSLSGCFAAGDAATLMKTVTQGLHMGMGVGGGLVSQLQSELDGRDEL